MKKIKVGIIGCGTIGSALAVALEKKFHRQTSLKFICDHSSDKAVWLQKRLKVKPRIISMDQLIRRSDLVIEAASASISASIARRAMKAGKNVLVMSVGGLLQAKDLSAWAKFKKGKLWAPSGALAGVDGLLAAKQADIRFVRLITRKPPAGLREAPYFKNKKFPELAGWQEYCLFKGNAEQAVKAFPQNINVAAVLSLAGMGPEKTRVEIWTSNAYRFNQHEVTIEGSSGKIQTVTQNVPSPDNPKTSALAIYSAMAVLEKIFSSVRVGT